MLLGIYSCAWPASQPRATAHRADGTVSDHLSRLGPGALPPAPKPLLECFAFAAWVSARMYWIRSSSFASMSAGRLPRSAAWPNGRARSSCGQRAWARCQSTPNSGAAAHRVAREQIGIDPRRELHLGKPARELGPQSLPAPKRTPGPSLLHVAACHQLGRSPPRQLAATQNPVSGSR